VEAEPDFFLGEGSSGRVLRQASSAGETVCRWKEVVQECVVDCDRVAGIREGGESGGLSWGDQLLGCPDVVRGGFREEVSPVGSLDSFYGLEIAELRLPCYEIGVRGP